MQIDKVTLQDLSFLGNEHSVFSLIKKACTTQEGVAVLKRHVLHPPDSPDLLARYQAAVRFWIDNDDKWSGKISNGTIVMVQKFYETADLAIGKPNGFNLFMDDLLKWLFKKERHTYALFSIGHLADFLKGIDALSMLTEKNPPALIQEILESMKSICSRPLIQQIIQTNERTTRRDWILLGYQARKQIRSSVLKLIQHFARLDALHGMAKASRNQGWALPELLPADEQCLNATQLVHPLLEKPIGYDLILEKQKRFLFLTGANMSGKSTLLYALGIAALLAHLGMGVPAEKMKISFLEGIITNMHIEDNILLGESYFFAEVQRMKQTAEKLKSSRHHLVLMDELFKGTNGYDAYECSLAVIKGLLSKGKNLMALSTHLYELADQLKDYPEILFRFCRTEIEESGDYHFTYHLEEGVSQDRIGFLVLRNAGVLDLLREK